MTTPKGFICYARKDHDVVRAFHDTHLAAIEKDLGVAFWRDLTGIGAGEDWNDTIKQAVGAADVFLLMLSPDWCARSFIREEELPAIVRRVRRARGLVIPVLLSDCDWDFAGGNFQATPLLDGKLTPIDQ